MLAFRVVTAFDEFEDSHACLGLWAERTPVDELVLQCGKNLSAIVLSKHTPVDPAEGNTLILSAPLSKSGRDVLRALETRPLGGVMF